MTRGLRLAASENLRRRPCHPLGSLRRARNFQTGKNPLRAGFDIADVLRHRVGSAIGNTCRDPCGDLDVIRCALGDQAGLIPRPSVKILEVEAEIVQPVSDSLEYGVAGYLGQLLVEAGVENAKADGIVLNGLMRLDDVAEIVDICGRRPRSRSSRDLNSTTLLLSKASAKLAFVRER